MTQDSMQELAETANLDALYPVLQAQRMTAGWHKKRASLWKEPRTSFKPLHWRYELGRLALDQAGRWIGTELAERRNLLLFNPVGDNDYDTVRTFVAAYQMIKPGEYARAHWHTPNAMRLILDAEPGCYTVVDGVQLPMRSGDFLITPGGCWHSHFNEGQANAYWIDFLDVPLVHLLEPMLFGEAPEGAQPVASEPAEHAFYFPPQRTRPALDAAASTEGLQRLTLDTQPHVRTAAVSLLKLAAGAHCRGPRSTASRILAIVSGTGTAQLGDLRADWTRGDVLAVPSWTPYDLQARTGAVVLEVCDEPVLRALGFYREGREI